MNLNDITIVVPTKNEEKNIVSFLKSLPDEIKLLLIDSSKDRTHEMANKTRPHNTELIHKDCNIPEARQTGTEAAETEWLLFSDADIVFNKNYFKNLSLYEVNENTGAIMGSKLSRKKFKFYYRLYSFAMRFWAWFQIPIGSGSNMIIRKKIIDQIGGFDLSLTAGEDSDILWRVRKAGWKVVFNGKLKVYETDHRRLENGVLRKIWLGGMRNLFLIIGGKFSQKVRKSDWGYWKK